MRIIAIPLQKFDSSLRNSILFPTSATISLLFIIIFLSLQMENTSSLYSCIIIAHILAIYG